MKVYSDAKTVYKECKDSPCSFLVYTIEAYSLDIDRIHVMYVAKPLKHNYVT